MKKKQNQGTAKHSEVQFITKMLLLHQDMYSKQELERIFNVDKRNFTHALEKSERQKRKQQLVNPLDDYFAIANWYRTLDTKVNLEKFGQNIVDLLRANEQTNGELTIYSNDETGNWRIDLEAEIAEVPRYYLQELLNVHIIEREATENLLAAYKVSEVFSMIMESEFFSADESVLRSELVSYLFFCLQHPYAVYGYWLLEKLQQYYPESELIPNLDFRYLTPSLLLSQRLVIDPIIQQAIEANQAITFVQRQIKKQGEAAETITYKLFWPLHILSDGRTGRVYLFGAEQVGTQLRYAKPIIAESIEIKSIQLIEATQRQEIADLRVKQAKGFKTSFLYPNLDTRGESTPELYALAFSVPENETRATYEAIVRYQLGDCDCEQLVRYQSEITELHKRYPETETNFLVCGVADDVTRIIPWIRSFGRNCQIVAGEKLKAKFVEVLQEIRKEC